MRKPFFRSQTRSWYFKDDSGKMIRLGKSRDEAFTAWHKLCATGATPKSGDGLTVQYLIGEFLDWTKSRRSVETYEWYSHYLAGTDARPGHAFGQWIGSRRVADLRPLDLERWIDSEFPAISENGRLCAKRAVMRVMNWGVRKQIIAKNPLSGAEIAAKPGSAREASYQPRRTYLSEEQWVRLLGEIPDGDWLRDYLEFLRETGCRPQEARILEARHVHRELGLAVIGKDEAKGKRERTIPLNDAALAIVNRLLLKRPVGTLFTNRKGEPITRNMLSGRLGTLSNKLGFKVHAYVLRRSFITDALANGLTADVLKTVVGHSTTSMIDTVYSALERKAEFLRNAAERARQGKGVA